MKMFTLAIYFSCIHRNQTFKSVLDLLRIIPVISLWPNAYNFCFSVKVKLNILLCCLLIVSHSFIFSER